MNESEYQKWRKKQLANKRPDLKCLHDFLFVLKQYLDNPSSLVAQAVLKNAIACSERWVNERYAIDRVRSDTELLDWIEEEKPDIWFRTGYGVWTVSAEMDEPDFPRYDGKTLREAVMNARNAWEKDE